MPTLDRADKFELLLLNEKLTRIGTQQASLQDKFQSTVGEAQKVQAEKSALEKAVFGEKHKIDLEKFEVSFNPETGEIISKEKPKPTTPSKAPEAPKPPGVEAKPAETKPEEAAKPVEAKQETAPATNGTPVPTPPAPSPQQATA